MKRKSIHQLRIEQEALAVRVEKARAAVKKANSKLEAVIELYEYKGKEILARQK